MTGFIADENIPAKTVMLLQQSGIDIISVLEESKGLSDEQVIILAAKEKRILITFDKDFGRLLKSHRDQMRGLILLRFSPRSPQSIADRMAQVLAQNLRFEGSVLVVREKAIRIIPIKTSSKGRT